MDNQVPQRPSPPSPRRGSWYSTFAALLFLVLGAFFLMMIPGLIGVALVFGGLIFFGVIGFHYFVWGRWLGEILRQEQEESQDGE